MPIIPITTTINYIDIEVEDIVKSLALYDVIQVWRAHDNITFEEITAEADLPAVIDGTIAGTWNLNGTTLSVLKNSNDPITMTFVGTNPIDLQTIINQINLVFPKIASQVPSNTNRLRLTSDIVGLTSNLTLSGSSVSILGLATAKAIGKAHRVPLTFPTTKYRFLDPDGLTTDYYKIRFYNSKTKQVSPFTSSFPAVIQPIIDNSNMVTGNITVADINGNPLIGKRVIVIPMSFRLIGNTISLVSTQDRITLTTNQFGTASAKLVKGMTVRVYIEATGFEREIVIPNTDFNIIATASAAPDPFSIVTTPPLAIRVSL